MLLLRLDGRSRGRLDLQAREWDRLIGVLADAVRPVRHAPQRRLDLLQAGPLVVREGPVGQLRRLRRRRILAVTDIGHQLGGGHRVGRLLLA